ncbi:DUF4436 family protein [Microbacterium sp. X-17]|uniref:DUF4436 family protein n=1 Tax=Microbacterium sp. X-17 TaxID=3144404 RepID=UPI0031F49CED
MTDAPEPTRRRMRTRNRVIGIIAAVALLYIAVVALYALSGRVALTGEGNATDGKGLPLQISPEGVDAVADRMTVGFEIMPRGEYDASDGNGLSLVTPVTLLVTGTDGARTTDFPAGSALSPVQLRFVTEGDVQLWPFDTYTSQSIVAAIPSDGQNALDLDWTVQSRQVSGWTFDITVAQRQVPVNAYDLTITAHRAGATVAFGIVLLALMVVMPVLVLTVSIAVYRGRRKMEPSLMGWIGAMLFATIPLRTFLPGSPPIGSWIDYLIVLWVIAGLIVGLVIYVLAFVRWSPTAKTPDRTPPAEDAVQPPG